MLQLRMRRRRLLAAGAWLLGLVALPQLGRAHAPAADAIAELTQRIRSEPEQAELYLERGELYRVDGNQLSAAQDFERAARLDPARPEVDLYRGRLALDADRYADAEVALSRFLARVPGHTLARALRARAFARLGRGLRAAEEYSAAIALQASPSPELYLERAQALVSDGDRHLAEALRGLDAGLARLGDVTTLDLYAIELELQRGDCDAALARLDRIASHAARQDAWLARRGEILEGAGRKAEAREAYRRALEALEQVAAPRRHTRATAERETSLRSALARLGAEAELRP